MISACRSVRRALAAAAFLPLAATTAVAQQSLIGQVRHAGTMKPMAEVAVTVEGTPFVGVTDREGRFTIANVPPGTNHLVIAATVAAVSSGGDSECHV